MEDILLGVYGTHNDAAMTAIYRATEKVASEYGKEGVEVFEQWLDSVPAGEIFDLDVDAEKTASGLDEAGQQKLADADLFGRVAFHAFRQEAARYEKIAEFVEEGILESFFKAVEESKPEEGK
jgi:hypothetical protein